MSEIWPTLPQMFFSQAKAYRGKAALKVKRQGQYQEISWRELASQVEKIALGLIDLGVQPGDRVALLSENRPEWAAVDLSILSVGAATVPIYTTLTAPEIEYLLKDAGARVVFVSNPELMTKILEIQKQEDLKIVLLDAPYRVSGPRIWWLGELMGLGSTAGSPTRATLTERLAKTRSSDLASLIYTSGTTGPPKGVMLTHDNFLSNCRAVRSVLSVTEADTLLSFLPLSHVFERMAGYYFVLSVAGTIAYAENMEKVAENLLEVHPTVLTGVPRFYEKFLERVEEAVRGSSPLKRLLFRWAVRVGRRRSQAILEGQPIPWGLLPQYLLAQRLVFSKLQARLGGRLRFCISGSAPLSQEVAEFFYAMGILILEGYGLTETSPVISVNRPDRFRFGTVGIPLPGVEVRTASDGEILTRGPHVMKGYWNQPEATAEVIDSDGWFHTGDVGAFGPDGFLTITDRKKDLIKTSGGKMVAPQNLEAALKADPYIADAVVLGDRRKFIAALIVPHLEKVRAFLRKKGILLADPEELVEQPEVVRLMEERLAPINQNLAPFEQIKKFTLLPDPFTLSEGVLTPTLKVKRKVIAERYAAQIESMYRE